MNRPLEDIRAFAFDAYGTLFDVHSVVAACEEAFPGHGQALSQAWRARQLEYTWLRALMGRYEDFWHVTDAALRFACKSLGLEESSEVHSHLMDSYLRLEPFPEVREALDALARFPLSILSNGSPRMLQAVVEHAGLADGIGMIISVHQVRTYKPDPRVYELAPRELGVPKESIAFVSANAWDVIGARAFGLRAIWVNRAGALLDELDVVPEATVSRLTEIPGLLAT